MQTARTDPASRSSNELQGKLKVVRVDVDKSPMLARAFRVQSIPMMVLIHEGRPVDQIVGLADKKTILALVQPVLPKEAQEVSPQDLSLLLQQKRALAGRRARGGARSRAITSPGAVHVPAADLVTRAEELRPSDGRVRVVYGRGGDEGKELAAKLREAGVQVGFLAGGFLHWEAAGLEVERGG